MGMSFGDFLEHANSLILKQAAGSPLSDSHVFYMGENEAIEDGIQEVVSDIMSEMRDRVRLPFNDICCVSRVNTPGVGSGFVLDRLIEYPGPTNELLPPVPLSGDSEVDAIVQSRTPQVFRVIRVDEKPPNLDFREFALPMVIRYYGSIYRNGLDNFIMSSAIVRTPFLVSNGFNFSEPQLVAMMENECKPILRQAAAISHPMNYIVKVSPDLSPREEKRKLKGDLVPIKKKPHFIVIDHDVLVRMRSGDRDDSDCDRAGPVPHHRRGHWKRLAERCRHARLLGKSKVWVRPTFVGDPVWKAGKNLYEVVN